MENLSLPANRSEKEEKEKEKEKGKEKKGRKTTLLVESSRGISLARAGPNLLKSEH